ncbi:hypothetical protein B0I00_2783 [Novosphingobium kunmingense]|uniref:Uncharacterized protein n=1 Tax=Novosphingobium kunmingense TaxID=1211806 RepID=A0A2N0H5F9_9SPHN|nr:hypothetical protein B0I00_2783 [Novosphingobium kunmingense]
MTKVAEKTARWTKPVLTKLGNLKDVAGGNPNPTQNVNNS